MEMMTVNQEKLGELKANVATAVVMLKATLDRLVRIAELIGMVAESDE